MAPKLKVPIARLGSWFSNNGVVSFDQGTFDSIQTNFKKNFVGYEPYLKAGHNEKGVGIYDGEKAEAHMVDTLQEGDVLFGIFQPNNADVVADIDRGAYRYSSAEVIYKAKDRDTGRQLGPLLRGVALTNTPFIPNLPRNTVIGDANLALMLSDSPVEIQVIRSELTDGVIMADEVTNQDVVEIPAASPETAESSMLNKLMDSVANGLDKLFASRMPQATQAADQVAELQEAVVEAAQTPEAPEQEVAPEVTPETEETPAALSTDEAEEASTEENTVTPEEIAQAQAEKEAALAKAGEAESALAISQAQLQALLDEKSARDAADAVAKEEALKAESARKEEAFAVLLSDRAAKLVSEFHIAPVVADKAKALVKSLSASVSSVQLSDGGESIDLIDAVFDLLSDRPSDFEVGQVGGVDQTGTPFDPWGAEIAAMRAAAAKPSL